MTQRLDKRIQNIPPLDLWATGDESISPISSV